MDITWFPNSWIRIRKDNLVIYFDSAYLTIYFKGMRTRQGFQNGLIRTTVLQFS